jgi:hypothetical protein
VAVVAQTGAGNVTTATNASSSGSGTPVSKPSNTADGDLLMVAGYFRNSAGTVTTDAGWTQWTPFNTTNETFGLFSKPILSAAGESATSYTFNSSAGAGRLILICFRVTGADLTTPQDAAGTLAAYTGTTSVSLPAVSAVSSAALLLGMAINNTTVATTSVFTADGAMTEVGQATVSTGAATSSIQVAQQSLSASGSTGTRGPTISPAAANSGGLMVTVDPVVVAAWTYGYGVTIG